MPASKTAKHKEGNKHRFLTFSERVAQVSINAVHHIKRTEAEDDEEDSKFHSSILKWRDQDRSLQFQEFWSEISMKSHNYKMIVYYKDEIAASLLKHLATPDSLALQALCELLVSLCMDLRSDFYSYFRDAFIILTKLLNTKEVDRLEWIFNAISLLFKYLWRYMISDINNVLNLYKHLIDDNHPTHIATFAAESATFLIRKAAIQEGFFKQLFTCFKSLERAQEWLGKVLFYVFKSVNGSLFSRTEEFLQQILSCLNDEDGHLPQGYVFDILNAALCLLVRHVAKDSSQMIWSTVLAHLKVATDSEVGYMLKLVNTWCSHGNGILILDADELFNAIQSFCKAGNCADVGSLLDLCVTLTKSEHFGESKNECLISTVISSKTFSMDVLFDFWGKILPFTSHCGNARRSMLKFCQVHIGDHSRSVLHLLTDYILSNTTLPIDAKEVDEYRPFGMDYALLSREKGIAKIQDSLKAILQDSNTEPSVLWMALLTLQHIKPPLVTSLKLLTTLFDRLGSVIKNCREAQKRSLAMIRMIVQTGLVMGTAKASKKLLALCSSTFKLLIKILSPESIRDYNFLFLLDMICAKNDDVKAGVKNRSDLIDNLRRNLSSHDAIVRKFSLRILCVLYPDVSIFKICLTVEETPATIQTFRDKVLYLEKLKYSTEIDANILDAMLRFLMSNLYINFSSYWPCVQEKIASFLPGSSSSLLWPLLFDLLDAASLHAESPTIVQKANEESPISPIEEKFLQHGVEISFSTQANTKTDYCNYRILFWKTLAQIPHNDILEKNNRRIVMLFLKFLDEEYYQLDKSYAPHQNLLNAAEKKGISKDRFISSGKKQSIKTLNAYLDVMAKLKNPAACLSADKLKSIYEDLLMHGDSGIQKSALTCLIGFRDRNISAFKEQLFALLDDEKIRETMVQLNLSEVEADKRRSLIPVLFRLMYGRIVSKSGIGAQGRKRRSTVLRFLSGLTQDEMQGFIFLAIKPVTHYVDEEDLNSALDEKFKIGFDLTTVVPLSRQHGILGTISEIIGKHANLLSKFMFDYLLKLLLSFHLSYHRMIQSIETNADILCEQNVVSYLRSLSKQAHIAINSLIKSWPESSTFTSQQIQSMFFVLVDPHVHKLQNECVLQPTTLLNLFNEFSKKPKFFPLLGQTTKSHVIEVPMEAIMATLVSDKTSPAVAKFIMEMLVRLLGEEDTENATHYSENDLDLIKTTLKCVTSSIVDAENTDLSKVGLELMVNFVGDILRYFIGRLKDKKSSATGTLIQSHLKLLIALGENITDVSLSNELVELLLNHISAAARAGRSGSLSAEGKMILPALKSLNAIPQCSRFLPAIGKLFSRVKSRECRILLTQIFTKAASRVSGTPGVTLAKACSIVKDLNAWDKRFIEELDYDSRLAGFQELTNWLEDSEVASLLEQDYVAFLALIHNCIFTLDNHSNDLSLREMSSRSLELSIALVFKYSADACHANLYHTAMSSVILPAVRRGLSSDDESQRHEWLRLLIKVAKLALSNNTFSNLTILCNDTDPDADFFANVQHIQMHRRTRAFVKLAQVINRTADNPVPQDKDAISHVMVTNYLLPLATQTLKCRDLSKHLHLRDACLEVVSACANVMPWSAYLRFLRQCMAMMMRHPQGVKIVCSVLNSFHFDVLSIPYEKAMELESSFISMKTQKARKSPVENEEMEVEAGDIVEENETWTIYSVVVGEILPRLCENLSGKLESDSSHKLADSLNFSDIDKCTIRAPLAVAVIALLRKLPARILRLQLPTVILRIVAFLRHHYVEVRSTASKVMVQITELLGPSHLPIILKELRSGLTRGYQKHVLIHTINCVLYQLENSLEHGDLEPCSSLLLSIINDDLFGKCEEERGVNQIKSKISEARGRSKAYNIYKILARFSKKESLLALISPLKKVLDSSHDHKKRKVVEAALEEIGQGVQVNSGLSAENMMIFLHGLLSENMPGIFKSKSSTTKACAKKNKQRLRPESCYLLSTEPERYGKKETKKIQKTNLHLLIEFSLQLLNGSLKRQVIKPGSIEHLQMLDPFVEILKNCLDSAHSKTVTEAIRCLTRLFKTSLPSLDRNADDITKGLFKVLRENSRGSANNELAAAAYKALSVLCSSNLGATLSETQQQVLLGYAEEMLYERDRQSHAFNVIQSILGRRLKCNEVLDVMNKIRDICIRSHDNAAMVHARQVFMYFLTNYPMTKSKLTGHVEFVLAQLSFEYESGRLSALELLASIIGSLPDSLVKSNAGAIFVPLAAMLLNDESVKCKKLSAHVLKMLLDKIAVEEKDQLFSLLMQWYQDTERSLHQQLAAMLVSVFAEAEGGTFSRHLPILIPVILEVLSATVEKYKEERESVDTEDSRNNDHFIFHQLSALHAVLRTCNFALDPSRESQFSSLLQCTEDLLLHPHTWVRLTCCQIFGTVFACWEPREIADKNGTSYFKHTAMRMRILTSRFCLQIQAPTLDAKLADQCVKNLLYVARVLHKSRVVKQTDDSNSDRPVKRDPVSILLYRLLKIAKYEAANNIKETDKRTAVLKFYAAVCVSLDDVEDYVLAVTELVYRESERKIVEEDQQASALKALAAEVSDVVRTKVGTVSFANVYADVRKRIVSGRRERKRKRDVELVADPQRAAATKQRRQQKKKIQRKRKIASFRPEYGAKLSKRKKTENSVEI